MDIGSAFDTLARKAARFTGSAACFLGALVIVLVWSATGPMFKFNQTWQLIINTGTTIVTFLMVFLIQRTQNVDTTAMQIKLDELIRAISTANNKMLALEELDDETLDKLRTQFDGLARKARQDAGHSDNDPGDCDDVLGNDDAPSVILPTNSRN